MDPLYNSALVILEDDECETFNDKERTSTESTRSKLETPIKKNATFDRYIYPT